MADDPGWKMRAAGKTRRNEESVSRCVLADAFKECTDPSRAELQQLAVRAGITTKQVSRWFRNQRHRVRDPAAGSAAAGAASAPPRSSGTPSPLDSDAEEKSSPRSSPPPPPPPPQPSPPRKQARAPRARAGVTGAGAAPKAARQPARWRLKLTAGRGAEFAANAASHASHATAPLAGDADNAVFAGSLFAHLGDGQDATPAWYVLDGNSNSEAGEQGMAAIGSERAVHAAPARQDALDAGIQGFVSHAGMQAERARYNDGASHAGMQVARTRYDDDAAPDAGRQEVQARYDAGAEEDIRAARQHHEVAVTEEYRRAAAVWTELRRHFESPASAEAASAPYLLTDANGRLLFAPVFASNADTPPSVVSLIRSGNNGQIDQGILLGLRRLFELHRQYFVALAPYFLAPT